MSNDPLSPAAAADALDALITADVPAMLWGAPGVGKSDTVRAVAARRGWTVIDFRASTRDPVALMGLPTFTPDDTTAWRVPDEFPRASRDGAEGLLFLDELNAAAPSMQAACFGLVLDRSVGSYTLPAGWRIVAAGNRAADKAAAQAMPSALANRFAHLDVAPDFEAWEAWAMANNVSPLLIAFLKFRQGLLHKMPETREERAFPTPRAWAQVSKILGAPDAIRPTLIRALVGEGPTAELNAFVQTFTRLPAIRDILADPDGSRVPDAGDVGLQCAVALALSRAATTATLDAVLRYLRRLPSAEFATMAMQAATKRDASLCNTAAYITWASANVGTFQ